MRFIAERRSDPALAEKALAQIQAATDACRDSGHAANAATFESQLPTARALVEKLRAP